MQLEFDFDYYTCLNCRHTGVTNTICFMTYEPTTPDNGCAMFEPVMTKEEKDAEWRKRNPKKKK